MNRLMLIGVAVLAVAGCGPKKETPSGLAPVQKAGKEVESAGKKIGQEAQPAIAKAGQAVQTAAKNPKSTAEDISITSRVKSAFGLDKVLNNTDINVTTNNGVVTLEGTVASDTQKTEAAQVARKVDGVKSVVNKLKTGARPAATTKP